MENPQQTSVPLRAHLDLTSKNTTFNIDKIMFIL